MSATSLATPAKTWTYADYLRLEDQNRYEILEGELLMAPAPNVAHQTISMNLSLLLSRVIRENALGVLFAAPVDVILDESNVVQPDLVFISGARQDIVKDAGVFGAPDLVIEILSPTTQYRDNVMKKDLYERFGVPEYWIVNPGLRSVDILCLEAGKYRLHQEASLDDPKAEKPLVTSPAIPALRLELGEMFAGMVR